MSYDIERKLITNHIQSENFFGFDRFGLDSAEIQVADNCGFMSINNGTGVLSSVGGMTSDHNGILHIVFFMAGGKDSTLARRKADTIIASFLKLKLSEGSTYVDFARGGAIPYIASITQEIPFLRTVVNCPFLRVQTNI